MNTMFAKIGIPTATGTTVLDLNVLHINYGCTSFFSYDQEWARENNMLEVLFEEMNHELFHPKRPVNVVVQCDKPTRGAMLDIHMVCLFFATLDAFRTYSPLADFMHRAIFHTAQIFKISDETSGNNMCGIFKNIFTRFKREATQYTPNLVDTNYPMWDAMQLVFSRTAAKHSRGALTQAGEANFITALKNVFPTVKNVHCPSVETLAAQTSSLYGNCMQATYIQTLESETEKEARG